MAHLWSLPQELIDMVVAYLSPKDIYHLAQTNQHGWYMVIGSLYKVIKLDNPTDRRTYRLVKSLVDKNQPHRLEALRHIRVRGTTTPWELSLLRTDPDGERIGEDMIDHSVYQASNDTFYLRDDFPSSANRTMVQATYSCTIPTLAMFAVLAARNLQTLEWRVQLRESDRTTPTTTPLQLLLAAMEMWIHFGLPLYPNLRKLVLAIGHPNDTRVPLIPSLKRLAMSGSGDNDVNIDLIAVDNDAQDQLQELVTSKMNVVQSTLHLLDNNHLQALRTLCMHTSTRQVEDYKYPRLVERLAEKCPNLYKMVLDCDIESHILDEPTPDECLLELRRLTTVKHLKIHNHFLLAEPGDVMEYLYVGSRLPRNVETLVLSGLDMEAFGVHASNQENSILFLLSLLRAELPSLQCIGLRFDLDWYDIHGDHEEGWAKRIRNMQRIFTETVAEGESMGVRVGMYVHSVHTEGIVEELKAGHDIQAEHFGEAIQIQ